MCGIYGFAKKEGTMSVLERFKLRGALMDLAYQNETRGKDGTGLVLVSASQWTLFKEATPSGELLKTKRFQGMIREINDKTQLCLGHTRLATIGDVRNKHCHPFVTENFLGVHNGHFLNREELLKKYSKTAETPVDSEAIFRVLDGQLTVKGMVAKLSEMEGDFALGFALKGDPWRLFLIRNNEKPLHVAYVSSLKTLFWSSDSEHLEYALARNGLQGSVWAILEDHLYVADVRCFDSKSRMKKTPCKMKPYEGSLQTGWTEDDFHYSRQSRFFSFDELQDFGLLDGSEMHEHSKIRCVFCDGEFNAEDLFYDDTRGRFLCEACSFESSHSGNPKEQSEKTADLFQLTGI